MSKYHKQIRGNAAVRFRERLADVGGSALVPTKDALVDLSRLALAALDALDHAHAIASRNGKVACPLEDISDPIALAGKFPLGVYVAEEVVDHEDDPAKNRYPFPQSPIHDDGHVVVVLGRA